MNRSIYFLLFFSLILYLPLTSAATEKIDSQNISSKNSFLFVIQANNAEIKKNNDGQELILKNVASKVIYFNSGFERVGGFIPSNTFIQNWLKVGSSFNVVPPNAAIVFDEVTANNDGVVEGFAVELKNPTIIGNNSWRFNVKFLKGELNPGKYNYPTLFVDSVSWPGGPQ